MSTTNPVRIGVVGVGHLGDFHLQQWKTISEAEVVGIHDTAPPRLAEMVQKHAVQPYESLPALCMACDAIDIVTPTKYHYDVARLALDHHCHLFIEKPITRTLDEARDLLRQAGEAGKRIQVGHIERFNPAFVALPKDELAPQFIEAHRLAPFVNRGTDVAVILDLMIHDIDLVLSMVPADIRGIHASGVRVASDTADIANARLEFSNGAIANLTASRISVKKMRKLRIFQEKKYFAVDLFNGVTEVYQIQDEPPTPEPGALVTSLEGKHKKYVIYRKPPVEKTNALNRELAHFVTCIRQFSQPLVDGSAALKALEVALRIQQIIEEAQG